MYYHEFTREYSLLEQQRGRCLFTSCDYNEDIEWCHPRTKREHAIFLKLFVPVTQVD